MIWVVEADGQKKKKKRRGVLKGVKAAQKLFAFPVCSEYRLVVAILLPYIFSN
jgi:transcription elongation factor Elf1